MVTQKSFPGGSVVKNLPAMQEPQGMQVQSLGWEDPLEEGMATHSSILAQESHGQRSLMGAIRVVSSASLRLLIFLPAILIPVCASSSPAFLIM